MKRRILCDVTLWLGMYSITATLFWWETGVIQTGLRMGLISATLKTAWSILHKRLSHKPVVIDDSVRI